MDKNTKQKVIDMVKNDCANKKIASSCKVSKFAVSRATSSYNKLGKQYFDLKSGHPLGKMHSITTEQQTMLEAWLVQSGLLTVKEIRDQTAILCGTALTSQTIHNYLSTYFCKNEDYKVNYILANPRTKQKILPYNGQYNTTSTWILSYGSLNGINVIAVKYRHTHNYYFFRGVFTPSKAKRFMKLFVVRNQTNHVLFIPYTPDKSFSSNDIALYCQNNQIKIYLFSRVKSSQKVTAYIPWDPYSRCTPAIIRATTDPSHL